MERDINCPDFREHLKKQRKRLSFILRELRKTYPDYKEIDEVLNSFISENKDLIINP